VPAADCCYNTGKFETRKKDNAETRRKRGELGCGFNRMKTAEKARWERKKASRARRYIKREELFLAPLGMTELL
jgi:hypothetical protein